MPAVAAKPASKAPSLAGSSPSPAATQSAGMSADVPQRPWTHDQRMSAVPQEVLSTYTPKGLFRNDYLAFCKLLSIRPHPCLLPHEPVITVPVSSATSAIQLPAWREPQEWKQDTSSSEEKKLEEEEDAPAQRYWDFTIRADVCVRNHRLGHADTTAMLLALKASTHTRSIHLYNAGLSAEQIFALGRALVHTAVCDLSLDFNPVPECIIVVEQASSSPAPAPAAHASGAAAARAGRPPSSGGARGEHGHGGGSPPPAQPQEPKRVHVFAALLRRGSQQLTRLSLRGNGLRSVDAAYISEQLRFNSTVSELLLGHNVLGDDGAAMILDAVRDNRSLRTLSLACNRLTSASVKSVFEAVRGFQMTGTQAKMRLHMESRMIGELLAEAAAAAAAGVPVPGTSTAAAPGAATSAPAADKKGKPAKEDAIDVAEPYRLPPLRLISLPAGAAPSTAAPAPAPASHPSSTTPRQGSTSTAAKGAKKEAAPVVPTLPHVLPLPSEDAAAVYAGDGNRQLSSLDVSGNIDFGLEGLLELAAAFTPASQPTPSAESVHRDGPEDSPTSDASGAAAVARSRATSQGSVSRTGDAADGSRRGSSSAMGGKVAGPTGGNTAATKTSSVPSLAMPPGGAAPVDGPDSSTAATTPVPLMLVAAGILPAPTPWQNLFAPTDVAAERVAQVRGAFASASGVKLVDAL